MQKRTAGAALKIAVDLVEEDLIDEGTALMRVDPEQISQLLHPQLDPNAEKTLLARGLNASPGAATGVPVIDPDAAAERAKDGTNVILVRKETSPEDIQGMHAARGILTATGGMTSHAAVVARGMGRPCVAGCRDLVVDEAANRVGFRQADSDDIVWLNEGEELTIDGATGEVFRGKIPTIELNLVEISLSFSVGQTGRASFSFEQMQTRLKTPRPQFASGPKALVFVALSTCSLHPTASTLCAV